MRLHKLFIILLTAAASIILFHKNSSALELGVGVYATGTVGGSSWDNKNYYYNGKNLVLMDSLQFNKTSSGLISTDGCGLMLNTGQIGDTIAFYRLNAGMSFVYVYADNKKNMTRFDMINTLGIRLVQDSNYKIWIGPQIMLNYLWGRDTGSDYEIKLGASFFSSESIILPTRYKRRYKMGGANIGAAAGIDYTIAESSRLTIEAGFRGCMYIYAGSMKALSIIFAKQVFYYSNPAAEYSGYEGYLSCGILFMIKMK